MDTAARSHSVSGPRSAVVIVAGDGIDPTLVALLVESASGIVPAVCDDALVAAIATVGKVAAGLEGGLSGAALLSDVAAALERSVFSALPKAAQPIWLIPEPVCRETARTAEAKVEALLALYPEADLLIMVPDGSTDAIEATAGESAVLELLALYGSRSRLWFVGAGADASTLETFFATKDESTLDGD